MKIQIARDNIKAPINYAVLQREIGEIRFNEIPEGQTVECTRCKELTGRSVHIVAGRRLRKHLVKHAIYRHAGSELHWVKSHSRLVGQAQR